MNFRDNMDVSWSFVGAAPPVMGTLSALGLEHDDRSIYPSPPAEHKEPLMMDVQCENASSQRLMALDSTQAPPSSDQETLESKSTASPSSSSLDEKADEVIISISTTFYPGNTAISSQPDTIFASSDGVLFYICSQTLVAAGFSLPPDLPALQLEKLSISHLGSLMGNPLLQNAPTKLPESSITLSIIFHIVYNISCSPFSPSLDAVAEALTAMLGYQLTPSTLVYQSSLIYTYLMSQYAPFKPLELFTLAASHHIEVLAVSVSSHLLGLDLSKVSDDIASTMGASYLRRLFFMHQGRLERLKKILLKPPSFHDDAVSEDCESNTRASLKRKWALMITTLVWDAKPDLSPFAIQQHLRLSPGTTACELCQAAWAERLAEASMNWATVKFTI